jgi:hypothetical protein
MNGRFSDGFMSNLFLCTGRKYVYNRNNLMFTTIVWQRSELCLGGVGGLM